MFTRGSVLLLTLFLGAAVQAQPGKMEFGVHAGPAFSTFYNEHPFQNPRNIHKPPYGGFALGVAYRYHFLKFLALNVEANYERKGEVWYDIASWNSGGVFTRSYANDRLNYVSVPLTVRFSFGKQVRFFAEAGMYGAVLINAHRTMSDTHVYPAGTESSFSETRSITDLSKDITAADAGGVAGIGLAFPLGRVACLTVEGTDHIGFVHLNNNTGLYQNRLYNHSVNLLFGLAFNLNHKTIRQSSKPKGK